MPDELSTVAEMGQSPRASRVRRYINTVGYLASIVADGRAALGLSLAETAERSSVSVAEIEAIEQGHPVTGIGGVSRLLDVLNVEPLAYPAALVEFSGPSKEYTYGPFA